MSWRPFARRHPALLGAAFVSAVAYAMHAAGLNALALLVLTIALLSFADAWDEETIPALRSRQSTGERDG